MSGVAMRSAGGWRAGDPRGPHAAMQPDNAMRHAQQPSRASDIAFLGGAALLFAASVWVAIAWSPSLSAMDEMPMPGGWTMSMAWMRMPGQSWLDAAATFLGMWTVMMVAMMVPSLVPMLWRFRAALLRAGATRLGWLTALAAVGYFVVWIAIGLLVYPLGVALAAIEMQHESLARFVPVLSAMVVLAAGALQFTAWKMRQLACCRGASVTHAVPPPTDATAAIRHGVRLGFHCLYCCAGPMAILLAVGLMDLGAMALITAAITAERLAPAGERAAGLIGGAAIATALSLMTTGVGLG